jgi:hypothetical protein
MKVVSADVHCTVRGSYAEDVGATAEAVRGGAATFFGAALRYDPQPPPSSWTFPASSEDISRMSRAVAQQMLAAARPPSSPQGLEVNRAVIEDRIARSIGLQIPIPAQMLWSPKKHWVLGADSDVDVAELMALNTLLSIHDGVRAIYRPGLAYTLHLEDLEFEFMEGVESDLNEARNRYIAGLRRVVTVLGLEDVFTTVRISEKARDEETLRGWFAQMDENYRALEAYWYESEANGIDGHEAYPSFAALRRLGWHGSIPLEMRNHYLRRLTAARDRPRAEKVRMILRNFSGILLHHQKKLLDTGSEVEPVKFSFIPPAPGAPDVLTKGRVDLRFVARAICSRVGSAGPWSTKGYFRLRDGAVVPAFGSWHGPLDAGSRFVPGHLTLIRRHQDVDVRADLLLES